MEVGNNDVGKHLKNFEIYNTSAFGPDCIISSSNEPNLDVLLVFVLFLLYSLKLSEVMAGL